MKTKILLILCVLPMIALGQKLELSAKGGVCLNNFVSGYPYAAKMKEKAGLSINVAGAVAFAGMRAGLNVSLNKIEREVYVNTNGSAYWVSQNVGFPSVPIELFIQKTIALTKLRMCFGAIGGSVVNAGYRNRDLSRDVETNYKPKTAWFTYGGIVSVDYKIAKRILVGLEAQPKMINTKKTIGMNLFVMPVLAGITFIP